MKIFFTTPYEGKKYYQKYIDQILYFIESTGAQVVSPEKSREYQDVFRKENLNKYRNDRDRLHYEFIRQGIANSDAVIIETSYEDFRVGHEATLALIYRKPLLCLSHEKNYGKHIAYEGFRAVKYTNTEDLKKIVISFLSDVSKSILSKRKKGLNVSGMIPESSRGKKDRNGKKVVLLGAINIDMVTRVPHYPKEDEAIISEGLKLVPGGKATNTAIGIARLGGKPFIIGKTGNDFFGEEAVNLFKKEGVVTEFIDVDSFIPTGTIMITVNDKGKSALVVNEDANIRINKRTIAELLNNIDKGLLDPECFYLSLEPLSEIVEFAIKEFKERSIPILLDASPQARPIAKELYPLIDFFTCNEQEASAITETKVIDLASAEVAAKILRRQGAQNIIITLGKLGAIVLKNGSNKAVYFSAYPVKAVDETACGDAFRAAFIMEYFTSGDIDKAVKFGNLAGGYAATRLGAYEALPTHEQLELFQLGQNL